MKMNTVEHLLLGHPYLRDTSIQGAQNLALSGKMCIFYLYLLPTLMRVWPRLNLHSRDTLALKTWLTTEIQQQQQQIQQQIYLTKLGTQQKLISRWKSEMVDKFKCALITRMTAFTKWTISLKLHLWEFNTQHSREMLNRIVHTEAKYI